MTQTTGRLFDEMARLVNDAAGVAQGVRREAETVMRAQMERFLRDMDLVKREEFEAVKDMAAEARMENERLAARIAVLEANMRIHTHPTASGPTGPETEVPGPA
ncbi:accessory factor UbiK family protein [Xanthobacter autotrophicus DSM 597]|uniref:accessory factor UbiK family protein n=1 Tax=Xanthobacter TaxID=279 RepID=UPI001AE8A029|nr:accessory factor UbiK family protein [Xanthobacter flavus]MBP2148999.1 BMFP domain-containing protein YqiC [Xanthobacter flavus]